MRLDGDELRQVLADEAYTREERLALGMRYSRLCQLLTSQGVYVIIAVIGLFEELHVWNRENIDNYIEVFVDVPLSELKIRDPKGLYSRYKKSEIHNIAGLDLQVDFPKNPDIHIKWEKGRTTNSMFEELLNKYV